MAITKIQCLNEAHTGNPAAHLKNALSYIQNPEKTEENVLVGSINCLLDTAFEQMMDTKVTFGKTDKRQGYHIIRSDRGTGTGYSGTFCTGIPER
mgnify:CR=1 FL=1